MERALDRFEQHCVVFDLNTDSLYFGPNEIEVFSRFQSDNYLVMEQWSLSRIRRSGCLTGEPRIEVISPITHDLLVRLARTLKNIGYTSIFQIHYQVNGIWTMSLISSLLNES